MIVSGKKERCNFHMKIRQEISQKVYQAFTVMLDDYLTWKKRSNILHAFPMYKLSNGCWVLSQIRK